MSVPVKIRWGAGGHENAGQRRAETLPPCRRATPSPGGSAAKRPPPALAAPVCPRWRSVRGRPSPPWPRGREWGRSGAAAAGARHAHLGAFAGSSAAKRPPPATAAPVCPRWMSVRGRPSPPWPCGRAWGRAGAAAASAGAAMAARGRFHRQQRRETAAAGPGSPAVPSLEVCPRAPQRALAAGAGMGAHRRRRSERPPSSPRRLGTKDTAPKIPKFAQTAISFSANLQIRPLAEQA